MEKTAQRKTYKDPTLNKIIQEKAAWNRQVSSFINDIIHFKKSMNGWPSKYYKERTRITQPTPVDLPSILSQIAGDFQEIANQGNSILGEQREFANAHVKRKGDETLRRLERSHGPAEGPPTTPPTGGGPKPDLTQQLGKALAASSHASDEYLISEASNPLSRFFHKLLQPGIGGSEAARIRKYRNSLLNTTFQLHKELKEVQKAVVGSGPQSIFVASQLLNKVEDNFVYLFSGVQAFKEAHPQGATNTGGTIVGPSTGTGATITTAPTAAAPPTPGTPAPPPAPPAAAAALLNQPNVQAAMAAVVDIQTYGNSFKGTVGLPALRNAAGKFHRASPQDKASMADAFLQLYQQMLMTLAARKQIPPQPSMEAIVKFKKPGNPADDHLQATAQNILGKWKHQISPFDKTSAFRLDIYNIAKECRKLANEIMDQLEEGFELDPISSKVLEMGTHIFRMKTLMTGLTSTIKGTGYHPQFQNLLERGLLTDHDIQLDPKQKQHLQKMLERRQLGDITRMYGNKPSVLSRLLGLK